MKTTVIIIALLLLLLLVVFFFRGFMSRSGEALGLANGQLTQCPDKPNCVCSESAPANTAFVSPILLQAGDATDAWMLLKSTIIEQGGQVQVETDNYLAATFTSTVFGFADDVEARLDVAQGVIHLRSASRVGHSDFGVNRKRVELLKKRYAENM